MVNPVDKMYLSKRDSSIHPERCSIRGQWFQTASQRTRYVYVWVM